MTEQHKPFDPAVPKRLRAAVAAATLSHSTFASPRASDLEQLLERDAYAEQTRLQLAEKCATYRSQRDEAYSSIWLIAQSLASLAAFQLAATPDDSAWNIVNASAQQLLAAGRPQRDQKAAHAPQERPASAPATMETNPTPNGPQTGVPPLEAAGIFFPGSTPSAIPELAETPLSRGDRVRLIARVGHLAVGCEGRIVAPSVLAGDNRYVVAIDGYMETICPRAALQRIDTPRKEA